MSPFIQRKFVFHVLWGFHGFLECGLYWNRVLSNKLEMDFTIRIDSTVRRDMNNASTLLKIQFKLIVSHLIAYKQHPLNSEIEVSRFFSTYSRRNGKHWVRHLVSRSKLDTGNIIQYKHLGKNGFILFYCILGSVSNRDSETSFNKVTVYNDTLYLSTCMLSEI